MTESPGPGRCSSVHASLADLRASLNALHTETMCTQPRERAKLRTVRRILCQLVEDHLTNISKVSRELSKKGTPESVVILTFLKFCIQQFPQIFCCNWVPSSDSAHEVGEKTSEQASDPEYHLCKNLSCWILLKLVRILSEYDCEAIHQQVQEIICILLQNFGLKCQRLFYELTSEFIDLLTEMSEIHDHKFQGGNIRFLEDGLKFQHFQVDATDLLKYEDAEEEFSVLLAEAQPLVIEYYYSCYYIQLYLSNIFRELVGDIYHICVLKVPLLWMTFAHQIDEGQIPVKIISLEVITKLIATSGLDSQEMTDYLFELFASLLRYLSNNHDDMIELSDKNKLEEMLGKCLLQVFCVAGDIPRLCLSPANIDLMMQTLIECLVEGALFRSETDVLKHSVCHILHYVYSCVPSGYESTHDIRQQRRKDLNSALIQQIGCAKATQFLVPPLVSAIKQDHGGSIQFNHSSTSASESDGSTTATTDVSSSSGDERYERIKERLLGHTPKKLPKKRQMDNLVISAKDCSPVFHEISSHLTVLLEKNDGLMVEEVLEGIRSIIEIASICCASSVTGITQTGFQGNRTTPSKLSKLSSHKTQRKNWLNTWLSDGDLGRIFQKWQSTMQSLISFEKDHVRIQMCFKVIVQSITCLLSIIDCWCVSPSIQYKFAWLLSLPWLAMESSWLDLKIQDAMITTKGIGEMSSSLAEKTSVQNRCLCIQGLSLLPREIASKWRTHIFRNSLASDNEDVRQAGVKFFPWLLYSLGPNSGHLVLDLLHIMVKDTSLKVKEELATSIGNLVCTLARQTRQKRKPGASFDEHLYMHIYLQCDVCPKMATKQKNSTLKAATIEPDYIFPFLQLIEGSTDVQLAFIDNIDKIFRHLNLQTKNTVVSNMLNACFDLIENTNYNVRLAFSKTVQCLVDDNGSINKENIKSIVTKLKTAFLSAKSSGNSRKQETVVLTIGHLGRVAEGELLLVAVFSLLESLLSSAPLVKATAFIQLEELAKAKGLTMAALYVKFKHSVCKFLIEALHEAHSINDSQKDNLSIISEVSRVFQFKDVNFFLESSLKFTLPHIVSKATPAASSVLRLIAKTLKKRHREMLVENFKYIFSFLVRTCIKAELETSLRYIESETDVELGRLIRMDYQSLHNQLLLYLGQNFLQVFNGLVMLASKDENYRGPKPITEAENMADFLQPRLLGILAFFDSQLLTNSIALEDKKLALESLVSIMKLMGAKHITTVRVKVMTTLKISLQFKEQGFPVLSCRAWDCFVRSVDLSSLGQMLSQIVITLLPLLHQLPEQVASIYHYLIVENRQVLSCHFYELYFMPEISELQEVQKVLQEHTDDPKSQTDLRTQLSRSIKGITHESIDVRVHALSKLRDLLHDNQAAFHEFVMGRETVDPIVSELVSVMLSGCRDSDKTTRSLYGECLGELGAIDPGRLDLNIDRKKGRSSKFEADVNDNNFAFKLISELARAFLAAEDTRAQDCSAYAIQELLQIYNCHESKIDNPGGKLWKMFPEHIQEILLPLLHTKYVPSRQSTWASLTKPIYRSRRGKTYKEWVCTWTGYLVSKVKQDKPSKVFRSCSMIIKHDIKCALFLLPHILLHALLSVHDQDREEICAEIQAVLAHAEKMDDQHINDFCQMSAQTIFSVLDHLTQWQGHKIHMLTMSRNHRMAQSGALQEVDDEYRCISQFLEQIPQSVLAKASFHCRAYTRALMHLESFIHKQDIEPHLGFLQKIYIAMDEPDGVTGVSAVRKGEPSLREQIFDHESIGQLRDASACYERAIQLEPDDVSHHKGSIRTMMDVGQLNIALYLVNSILEERPEWKSQLGSYRIDACWKLAKWDTLESHLQNESEKSIDWKVGLGRVLLAAKKLDQEGFFKQLQIVRSEQMGPLSAASMEQGSYTRGYEYIVRLHMLSEVEQCARALMGFQATNSSNSTLKYKNELLSDWENRLKMTQPSFRTQEPILCLRRVLHNLTYDGQDPSKNKVVGHCWLQSAKVARKAGHLQTAFNSLLNVNLFSIPELCIEKAKWLWSKGDSHEALISLQKGVSEHFSNSRYDSLPREEAASKRLAHAKALLMVGRLMEDTANFESNSVMKQYKDVVEVNPEWEDSHFYLAKYYDRLMLSVTDRPERAGEFILQVVNYFGQSLRYDNQYIYQSMPRLLTLWLNYGASTAEQERNKTLKVILGKLNGIISDLTGVLKPYQFLTAFSQLISRICHSHPDVFQRLKEIIAKVLVAYPQQAVWMSMAVSKSTHPVRQQRCQEIFERARSLNKHMKKFISDATKLSDRLLELCNKQPTDRSMTMSINSEFRSLKRLVDDPNFSNIIIPLQAAMNVTLPSSPGAYQHHDPFPGSQIYINGFDDVVEVLPSLMKPKKIAIKGSDGRFYLMMCKPKDDLRKDCRLMEFNAIVNKCLHKDAESRRRQLHIRTYAVVPLNEECGLIEWISNTTGLRHILNKIYREKNMSTSGKEIRSMIVPQNSPIEIKLNVFRQKLLPRHPPVFRDWFLRTFPDPTSWYVARLAYSRTCATMSMVGYILGLGDRHGENILLDSTTGDCVHVDFNCLFNKGETFDCPELVPFRLTHNMVDAMGPMGYEGVFRKACEATMQVMRDQRDPLMSVLKAFIYDPLVEWSKPSRGRVATHNETGEINNEKAVTHVTDIELRLQGILKNKKKKHGLPLSIQGHVHHLIQEATDELNLCQMYIGWAPFF
ncbi:serine/threonine-protein kinase ATR-like isoform X2 [Anneissia japonica]|uniref:serine/threonine-protein kinase ATR-like isoform X2 n=1 Tax=Anneissia japonica TaxID=1529436 RepID=UPI00142585EC|nr:serine/threonine-protein kinase ATR-like isoform X2 [Anneissia japonica]